MYPFSALPVCEEPALSTNGTVELSEDRLVMTFSCDVGFSLSGSEVLLCQPEGAKWNDISPTCGMLNIIFVFLHIRVTAICVSAYDVTTCKSYTFP